MKRGKRLLAALLGGLLIGLLPLGALAEEAPAVIVDIEGGETAEALMAEDADEVWEPVGTVPADTAALDVGGKSAVLMEQSSGDILFEKNPHEKMPIASVTKVMTLLLTMEAIEKGSLHYDDVVTVSAYAASMGGSHVYLSEGEQVWGDYLVRVWRSEKNTPPPDGEGLSKTDRFSDHILTLSDGGKMSEWTLRCPQRGDGLTLPGARGRRSVKRLLTERGMPPRRRRTTPVVCINGEPAAVYGVGTDQRFLPGKDGSNINILMIEKDQEEESNG